MDFLLLLFLSLFSLGSTKITILKLDVPSFISITQEDVILSCEYANSPPEDVIKVQWFLDNQLFCEWYSNKTFTKMGRLEKNVENNYYAIEPKKASSIRLFNVSRKLTGTYTCKVVGTWNEEQAAKSMVIYIEPKISAINFSPPTVIKGQSVTLECILEDPGYPKNVSFVWFRRGYQVHQSIEPKWVIKQASLDVRTTFGCMATNGPGKSTIKKVSIDVLAPPAILGKTSSYVGVSYLTQEFSLSCRIECYPLCSVQWFDKYQLLDTQNDPKYQEIVRYHPPDYGKNEFESIESVLIWKISNWPNGRLDKNSPPLEYTCASVSSEGPGPDIKFTTTVTIDTPPENLKVSEAYINVIKGFRPPSVNCTGDGVPRLDYLWKDRASKTVAYGSTLQLDKMSKRRAGYYTCEGFNKYGNLSAKVFFNVQYKPNCKIVEEHIQRKKVLICMADANPKKVSFRWKILNSNYTVLSSNVMTREKFGHWYSYLIVDSKIKSNKSMVYQCIAENSIGFSYPCQIEVSSAQRKKVILSWIFQLLTLPAYYGLK